MESQSREIGCYNDHIALKFDSHLGACQISERLEKSKPESRGFETSRYLAVRRLSAVNQGPGVDSDEVGMMTTLGFSVHAVTPASSGSLLSNTTTPYMFSLYWSFMRGIHHIRPVMRNFDILSVSLIQLLNKQSSCQWVLDTTILTWHHCNVNNVNNYWFLKIKMMYFKLQSIYCFTKNWISE